MAVPKKCATENCTNVFTPYRKTHKFCKECAWAKRRADQKAYFDKVSTARIAVQPPPEDRVCATENCTNVFTPYCKTHKFCKECARARRRAEQKAYFDKLSTARIAVQPPPEDRVCATEDCTNVFTPATHNHIFCKECARARKIELTIDRRRRNKKGVVTEDRVCATEDCTNVFTPIGKHHKFCKECARDRQRESGRSYQHKHREVIAASKPPPEDRVCATKDCTNVFTPFNKRHIFCKECARARYNEDKQAWHKTNIQCARDVQAANMYVDILRITRGMCNEEEN